MLRGEHTSAHGPRRPNVRPKRRDVRDGTPGQHRHNSVAHSISRRRSPRRGRNSLAPITLVPGGSNRVIGSRVLQYAKARPVLAIIAGVLFAGSAAAQSANPFAFLFGGAPQEGRSAYSPSPPYARPETIPGYSSLPGFSDPSIYEPRRLRHPHPRAIYQEQSRPHRRAHLRPLEHKDHGQSAKEVMAAIEAVKPGKGPLGPFLNDPTLRAGDIVVTTHGLMVFRGADRHSHTESEFVTIANASRLIEAKKKMLISLQTASRLTPQKPLRARTLASPAPASEVVSSAKTQSDGN